MALLTVCPVPSEITDIPVPTCIEDFGQITKLLLQRRYSTGTTENSLTIGTNNPNVLATWTTLLTAADGTKVQGSPQIDNSDLSGAEAVTYGGGDATAFGVSKVIAQNPASFTGEIHQVRQDVIDALKDYQSEILSVYLVNEFGQIAGVTDDITTPTTFKGFPIAKGTFFVSDKNGGKRESPDMNMIQNQFLPNWSDKFYVVNPTDFNGNDLA